MRCPTCRSGIGADIVWLAGVFNVDIKSIQGTMINIHLCALILGIRAGMPHRCWSRSFDEQEWSLHSPLREKGAADLHAVEKLAEWVDVLGSTQVTIRSDGEPAVQVAAAVRDARRETSAPGDHAGHGLAERAVGSGGCHGQDTQE